MKTIELTSVRYYNGNWNTVDHEGNVILTLGRATLKNVTFKVIVDKSLKGCGADGTVGIATGYLTKNTVAPAAADVIEFGGKDGFFTRDAINRGNKVPLISARKLFLLGDRHAKVLI